MINFSDLAFKFFKKTPFGEPSTFQIQTH